MRFTFFAPTVVGYLSWPPALHVRGLADALADEGHEVRVLEPRNNRLFTESLRGAGSEPARHFYLNFSRLQMHTYEPRFGTALLEWTARELALIDAAFVVSGVEPDVLRTIASTSRSGLVKVLLRAPGDNTVAHDGFDWSLSLPQVVAVCDRGLVAEAGSNIEDSEVIGRMIVDEVRRLRDARSTSSQSGWRPYPDA